MYRSNKFFSFINLLPSLVYVSLFLLFLNLPARAQDIDNKEVVNDVKISVDPKDPSLDNFKDRISNYSSYVYKLGYVIVVPVIINNSIKANFFLDTGSGINVLSSKLAKEIGLKNEGNFSGSRMTGQSLKFNTTTLNSLSLANFNYKNLKLVILDLNKFFGGLRAMQDIDGILSLNYFANAPFTIDYRHKQIIIENSSSLTTIKSSGIAVPVRVAKHDLQTNIFIALALPKNTFGNFQVDTGTSFTVVNSKFMNPLNVSSDDPRVKKMIGKDETGADCTRYITIIPGMISVKSAPNISAYNPPVMFQKIIVDGLLGQQFLSKYKVTFDLPESLMIFSR